MMDACATACWPYGWSLQDFGKYDNNAAAAASDSVETTQPPMMKAAARSVLSKS